MSYWFGLARGAGGSIHPVAFDERPDAKHPFGRQLVPGSLVEVPPDLRGASLEYLARWSAEQKQAAEPAPAIVEPEPPTITSLGEAGMACAEIAMTIRSAGQGGLARAIEDGHDPVKAKQVALGTLRVAHEDLGRLIEDIEAIPADGEFRL